MRWIMPEVSVARHPSIQFYTARTLTQLGDVYGGLRGGVQRKRNVTCYWWLVRVYTKF